MEEFAEKVKLAGYMTREEYDLVKSRANKLGMFLGRYIGELATYDTRYNMLPRLRDGARLVGRKK